MLLDVHLIRGPIASEWASDNPILPEDTFGVEKDTGKLKLGNGVSHWTELPYFLPAPGESYVAATEAAQGIAEVASLAEVAVGTDHTNRFVTPAGVRQERLALKAEILGGAGPAFDTLVELKGLVDSAEETAAIDALIATVANKADTTAVTAAITAAKAEILGGAGPAYDTLNELKTLIDAAEETTAIDALVATVGNKADASTVYTKTELGNPETDLVALYTAAKA